MLVVAAAGVGAVLLMGEGERSPEDTVRAFWEAERNGDCAELVDVVTERSWAVLWVEGDVEQASRDAVVEACAESAEAGGRAGGAAAGRRRAGLDSVVVISQGGDRAVVAVTTTVDGETSTYDIPLESEDGEWKVDMVELLDQYDDF